MADYLFDTNVLLRASDTASVVHAVTARAVFTLLSHGHELYVTAQNLIEFWAVATRPVNANGLGWSIEDTEKEVERLSNAILCCPTLRMCCDSGIGSLSVTACSAGRCTTPASSPSCSRTASRIC
jgi:predicted nucleic acid-binding protein